MSRYFLEDKLSNLKLCKDLQENYEQIKKEIVAFCNNPESLVAYPNYPVPGYDSIYKNYWKAAPLSVFKDEHVELNGSEELKKQLEILTKSTRAACPTFVKCIEELEKQGYLANSFISRLMPGTVINPHYGWTNNWLRLHFGLVCDPDCKLTVGKETKAWEEGKFLAFYDGGSYPHSVKHEGTRERIIVSVDLNIRYLRENINAEI